MRIFSKNITVIQKTTSEIRHVRPHKGSLYRILSKPEYAKLRIVSKTNKSLTIRFSIPLPEWREINHFEIRLKKPHFSSFLQTPEHQQVSIIHSSKSHFPFHKVVLYENKLKVYVL